MTQAPSAERRGRLTCQPTWPTDRRAMTKKLNIINSNINNNIKNINKKQTNKNQSVFWNLGSSSGGGKLLAQRLVVLLLRRFAAESCLSLVGERLRLVPLGRDVFQLRAVFDLGRERSELVVVALMRGEILVEQSQFALHVFDFVDSRRRRRLGEERARVRQPVREQRCLFVELKLRLLLLLESGVLGFELARLSGISLTKAHMQQYI